MNVFLIKVMGISFFGELHSEYWHILVDYTLPMSTVYLLWEEGREAMNIS